MSVKRNLEKPGFCAMHKNSPEKKYRLKILLLHLKKITKIMSMLTSRMKNLHPYIPGEQPKDRVYIKLNANENPYPPCKELLDGLKKEISDFPSKLSLYPDPDSNELKKAIAKMLNETGGVLSRCSVSQKNVSPSESDKIGFEITPEMIYTGNGSDEVLSFVFYAFFDSKNTLVLPEFTYSFYPVYAGFYGIETDIVPMKNEWSLDIEKMLSLADFEGKVTLKINDSLCPWNNDVFTLSDGVVTRGGTADAEAEIGIFSAMLLGRCDNISLIPNFRIIKNEQALHRLFKPKDIWFDEHF